MTEQELKPCPFCGGLALAISSIDDGLNAAYVYCNNCAARGPDFLVRHYTDFYSREFRTQLESNAIAAWNRRVKPEAHVPPSKPVDDWLRKIEAKLGIAKEMEADE